MEGNKFVIKTRLDEGCRPRFTTHKVGLESSAEQDITPDAIRAQSLSNASQERTFWRLEQAKLLGALDQWLTMLRAYSKTRTSIPMRDQQLMRILLMWHATAVARVKSALQSSEISCNDYFAQFSVVVENAEQFQEMAASNPGMSEFTFEMGVLPPLLFIILKCRFPQIRRRALTAMRRGPRKEGLWDREQLLTVSEKVLDLEHGSASNVSDSTTPVIPRVCDVKISPLSEGDQVQVMLLVAGDRDGADWRVSEALLHIHEGS